MADDPPRSVRALWRHAVGELDRSSALLLLLAVCLPVLYVTHGQPQSYIRLLGQSTDPLLQLKAQLWRFGAVFVLFFVVPFALHRALTRLPLSRIGLGRGDWRAAARLVPAAMALLTPLLWFASADPALQREYPMARVAFSRPDLLLGYELAYGLYYFGWEALFRGALQLGLRPRLGISGACAVQVLPSVLLHMGKPHSELWGAVLAGPLFGLAALRCGSFLPLFLLHWAVGVATDLFCAHRLGLLAG